MVIWWWIGGWVNTIEIDKISFSCAIAIFYEEKGILVGVIEVGLYGNITRADLARALGFNESFAVVAHHVEYIQGNNNNLAATLSLTEEGAKKHLYGEIWVDPLGPLRADEIFADLSR